MSTLSVATVKSLSAVPPVFQNSSGVEKGQLVKMWVSLNGTGTIAINDSFNVSSITDRGVGQYEITFANAMPNTNYCAGCSTKEKSGNSATSVVALLGKLTTVADGYSTDKLRISTPAYANDSMYDSHIVNGWIFGETN